jgi:hypothetical protein
MIPEFVTPTLKVMFTNEFGDKTEVTKDLSDSTIGSVVEAFRESLMGFGFSPNNVDDYIPEQ